MGSDRCMLRMVMLYVIHAMELEPRRSCAGVELLKRALALPRNIQYVMHGKMLPASAQWNGLVACVEKYALDCSRRVDLHVLDERCLS